MILLESVLQALLTSLLVGSIYGLLCVGLGLIFSVMRVINFAQGEFMMIGMYAALLFFDMFGFGRVMGDWGGLAASALAAGAALYLFASLLHPALLARVTGSRVTGTEGDGHYPQLTLTLGLSLVLANGGLVLFGSSPQTIRTTLSSSAWTIGPLVGDDGLLFVNKARTLAFVVTAVVVAMVALFITRTRSGKTGKQRVDLIQCYFKTLARVQRLRTHLQVFKHRHAAENLPPFGYMGDAQLGARGRGNFAQIVPVKSQFARDDGHGSRDGLEQG